MVVLTGSRAPLQALLDDDELSILVLSGAAAGSDARRVHDEVEELFERQQTWRRTVLVTDLALLTADERRDWLDQPDRHAFVARRSRRTTGKGTVGDLLKQNGEPSRRDLRRGFSTADRG